MDSSDSFSVAGDAKRTEADYGIENVVDTELHFFFNAKRRMMLV
jgi:hypothetical protein